MEIIALNPAHKRATRHATKGRKKMAKRNRKGQFVKGGGRVGSKAHKTTRRRYRRNPGNPPSTFRTRARHYGHKGMAILGGVGAGHALKTAGAGLVGVLAAALIRRKFGSSDNIQAKWEWKDYLMAGIGGLGASLVARHLFKASSQTAGNILNGALILIGFKLIEEKIVPSSTTLQNWIGAENPEGSWSGIGQADPSTMGYLPGDMYQADDGQTYAYGDDGYWRPINESHRMLGQGQDLYGMGDAVNRPGGLGEPLAPIGPMGLGDGDPYVHAYT
jgi:hypothetical protein